MSNLSINLEQCSLACCRQPGDEASSIGLCEHHMTITLLDWSENIQRRETKRAQRVPLNRVDELVYYIRMGERIKIGRSTNLQKRMATFYAQPDQLLAVEPCVMHNGVSRERQRHEEFSYCRVGSTELFLLTEELQSHIEDVVAIFGDPANFILAPAAH